MVLKLVALSASLVACLGTTPPRRLVSATPIAVHVVLESGAGALMPVPGSVTAELERVLRERNLVMSPTPPDTLGAARTSPERVAAVARVSDAPWILLVEARARFFSQLSGRYRWQVEVRTTLAARDGAPASSDLSVAAFLGLERDAEPEALAFVRRQLGDDVATLLDRVLASQSARHVPGSPRMHIGPIGFTLSSEVSHDSDDRVP